MNLLGARSTIMIVCISWPGLLSKNENHPIGR